MCLIFYKNGRIKQNWYFIKYLAIIMMRWINPDKVVNFILKKILPVSMQKM